MKTDSFHFKYLSYTLIGVLFQFVSACSSPPEVNVQIGFLIGKGDNEIDDYYEVLDYFNEKGAYIQLAVASGRCPAKTELRKGEIPPCARVQTVPFYGEDDPPEIGSFGNLKQKDYAFIAYLRGEECELIGFGCTNTGLDIHRTVPVSINSPVSYPDGRTCTEECSDGYCGEVPQCGPQ
ncbi:MAG: hypothetical protein FWD57_05070 [Polyangiaceae bacterium]|nr:hypothetical protein [Polyangiaceae bacterium]